MNRSRALWVVQGLLAAVFLFAGGSKLFTPVETLAEMSPFSGEFIFFIGVCEVLGAFGLVLPSALRVLPVLTPLAAVGLVAIMAGATASTLAVGGGPLALLPAAVGLLAALVVVGHRPQARRVGTTRRVLQPAH